MIILPSAWRVCVRAIACHLITHLFRLILVLFGVFTIIFIIPHLAPGGPERALIGWPYTAERAATLRGHYDEVFLCLAPGMFSRRRLCLFRRASLAGLSTIVVASPVGGGVVRHHHRPPRGGTPSGGWSCI